MAAELSVVYNYKDLFSTEPVVLVVSPLNALIKNQLSSCEKLGINATKIEGTELSSLEGKVSNQVFLISQIIMHLLLC